MFLIITLNKNNFYTQCAQMITKKEKDTYSDNVVSLSNTIFQDQGCVMISRDISQIFSLRNIPTGLSVFGKLSFT